MKNAPFWSCLGFSKNFISKCILSLIMCLKLTQIFIIAACSETHTEKIVLYIVASIICINTTCTHRSISVKEEMWLNLGNRYWVFEYMMCSEVLLLRLNSFLEMWHFWFYRWRNKNSDCSSICRISFRRGCEVGER
jgi:hypothetical protein